MTDDDLTGPLIFAVRMFHLLFFLRLFIAGPAKSPGMNFEDHPSMLPAWTHFSGDASGQLKCTAACL